MNIYIDFDRTLFDTNTFIQDLKEIVLKYDLSWEILKSYEKDNGFNIIEQLHLMEKDYIVDKEIYRDIDIILEKTINYLYIDTLPFLKEVKKRKNNLIMLTKGNYEFQFMKIKNTHILDYFDDVIVTLKKKGDLKIDYEKSIFIDDNEEEIGSILKNNPAKIYYINRYDHKSSFEMDKVVEIKSLLEIFE